MKTQNDLVSKTEIKPLPEVQAVVDKLREVGDFQQHGPKDHAHCPDCGAELKIKHLENGRSELIFIKHNT